MVGYVLGRTIGAGDYLRVASASTYLIFAGTTGAALFLFSIAPRARRRSVLQSLALVLLLDGAVVVAFPFSENGAAIVPAILFPAIGGLVAVGWRDLSLALDAQPTVPSAATGPLAWRWSALWIPIAAAASVFFALGDFNPTSSYITRWLAVAVVLVAVVGKTRPWAAVVSAIAAAVDAAYVLAVSTTQVAAGDTDRVAYVIAGLIVVGLSLLQLWRWIGRRLMLDPVQLIAVQLAVALLFRWAYYLGSGLGLDARSYPPGTAASPFRAELPLLALALAAVGLGLSRPLIPALRRVGMEVPRWWHVLLALIVAGAYDGFGHAVNVLTYRLMPGAYFRIGEVLYKTQFQLPYWAYLAYGLLAGICEEMLFRGALQPRVGIAVTAVLFAAIHIQYGLTPILGLVFVAGIAFGLIRRHINLTTAVIAHAATDTGVFPGSFDWRTNSFWGLVLAVAVVVDILRRRKRQDGGSAEMSLPPVA
jgi:membrane protease YdiL (CAAX protease family)